MRFIRLERSGPHRGGFSRASRYPGLQEQRFGRSTRTLEIYERGTWNDAAKINTLNAS